MVVCDAATNGRHVQGIEARCERPVVVNVCCGIAQWSCAGDNYINRQVKYYINCSHWPDLKM